MDATQCPRRTGGRPRGVRGARSGEVVWKKRAAHLRGRCVPGTLTVALTDAWARARTRVQPPLGASLPLLSSAAPLARSRLRPASRCRRPVAFFLVAFFHRPSVCAGTSPDAARPATAASGSPDAASCPPLFFAFRWLRATPSSAAPAQPAAPPRSPPPRRRPGRAIRARPEPAARAPSVAAFRGGPETRGAAARRRFLPRTFGGARSGVRRSMIEDPSARRDLTADGR